jgi:hypothetical protein
MDLGKRSIYNAPKAIKQYKGKTLESIKTELEVSNNKTGDDSL